MKGAGLVDGAVSPEKPEAHKPVQRKVSSKVSTVSRGKKAKKAKQEDDPHGLQTHGPQRTSKKNDPHGLLMKKSKMTSKKNDPHGLQQKESNMTRKKATPTGTTTAEDTVSTYIHADNPSRVPKEPGALSGSPRPPMEKTARWGPCGSPTSISHWPA